jgi:hypothetical protein
MRRIKTSLPSPSMTVAFLALLVAFGGTSYAVVNLPAKSVGAKQLKAKAVTTPKLKNNAVTGAKVRRNSLNGQDIDESELQKVPSAVSADSAANADRASTAGTASAVERADINVNTVLAPANQTQTVSASCDPGLKAVSAGIRLQDPENQFVIDMFPETAEKWTARVFGGVDGAATLAVICGPVNSVTGP